MGFIFTSFMQLGMVALIMGCSVIGTVGMLKFIKWFIREISEK